MVLLLKLGAKPAAARLPCGAVFALCLLLLLLLEQQPPSALLELARDVLERRRRGV